jgi:hypothetical protein
LPSDLFFILFFTPFFSLHPFVLDPFM